MKIITVLLFLFFFAVFQCSLYAETDTNLNNPTEQQSFLFQTPKFDNTLETGTPMNFSGMPEISIFSLFFKVSITLIVVLAFFYVVRKIIGKRRKIITDASSELFQTLAVYPLSGSKALQVIEFSDDIYLFGISDNGISLIEKIVDKDKIDTIKLYANMSLSGREKSGFFDFFVNTFSRKYKKEYTLQDFKKIDDYE